MNRYILPALALFSVLSASAAGQDTDYRFYENIDLGAAASAATCFLQDPLGMMWIGSDRGLFSYDGYSTLPHFDSGKFSNTRVHCAALSDSARFYIGTSAGLRTYNFRTDTYETPGVGLSADTRALLPVGGIIWVGTIDGLFTYDPASGRLSDVSEGLPHRTVYSLAGTPDGRIYIGTYNGCCLFDPGKDGFETIPLPSNPAKNNMFVNSLLVDQSRGCIWIGTEGNLFKYFPDSRRVQRIDELNDNSVKSLALDREGRLLAGTDNGLYVYKEGEPIFCEEHDSWDSHSLSNNSIWTIFTDKEKNIWLGTDRGVSLARCGNVFRHVSIPQLTGTGEGNEFHCIRKGADGDFWFGGTNGLLRVSVPDNYDYQRTDVTWYKMGDKSHPLTHNRIRDIYEDREGRLWIASDGGISSLNPLTGQFVPYNIIDRTGQYNANWAYSLFEDGGGRLWIATCMGGIFVADKQKLLRSQGRAYIADKNYTTRDGLSGMFVNKIIPDDKGNVWALLYDCPQCVDRIDPATGAVTAVPSLELESRQYPDNAVLDVNGRIWIGFIGGVMCIDPSDGRRTTLYFNSSEGCRVHAMTLAGDLIWVSTTDGLWTADCASMELHRCNISGSRFYSIFHDPQTDRLYMGTTDGFEIASSSSISGTRSARPLILSGLYVNGTPYTSGQSVRYTDRIKLSHDRNNISIDLTDLPYSLEVKNRIMYKLDTDPGWTLLPPQVNRIIYNNLHYGRYRLSACIPDDMGNPAGEIYSLYIRIKPPWYQTITAKILYILLFAALVVWAVNFRQVVNRYRSEQLEKNRIEEQSRLEQLNYTRQLTEMKARIIALTPSNGAKEDAASYDEKFLAKVTGLINEHISDQDLSVNALCEWTGTTGKQMYRKIKQLTGRTPVEYIKSIRMKIAAELLKEHKFTVTEVMYMVGFSNNSYFSKCFSARFGVTPSQYNRTVDQPE